MNKFSYSIYMLIILSGLVWKPADAQSIHLQMSVEPEISAEVIQDLHFGQFIVNSGINRIQRESPDIGIFRIRGMQNQQVMVSLDIPENLTHTDPAIEDQLPLSLEASYNNEGINNARQSVPINGNTAWFSLENSDQTGNSRWTSAYVFIYGAVTIGSVSDGNYTGNLVLTVEYQ